MTLPLPYRITSPEDVEGIQGNFDEIAKQFPLSKRNVKLEAPNDVGGLNQPTFQNGWINFDTTTYRGARFWKDSVGLVHIEGLVKSGTANSVIFVLPAGYRPGLGHVFATDSNSGHARIDVAPTGEVKQVSGGQSYLSITLPPFKQES